MTPRPTHRKNAAPRVRRDTAPAARTEKKWPATQPRRTTGGIRAAAGILRLNKFLSEAGVASRRKADELILQGAVTVNGHAVDTLGTKVHAAADEVCVNGKRVFVQNQLVYILVNKPKDCIVTTSDEKARSTVMDLVPHHLRLYPVGRLDRNTTGAILLTNDGDLAFALTHPKFLVEKVYRAELDRKVAAADLVRLRRGIKLDDGMTAPCEAESLDPPQNRHVGLLLREGRNRQIRRMFEALGYSVEKLERVRYAGLTTAGIKRGAYRYLEENEIRALKKLTRSSGT